MSIESPPARVWRVLADIEVWPSWASGVVSVTPESDGEQTAYRIDQPPLPHALWTITDWRPEQGFTWQTQGASSLLTMTFRLQASAVGTDASVDLQWSGAMSWMARAAYGPVSLRYADSHLRALKDVCDGVSK
ncbi:MAG: SRPBCC family protein [Ornithinimicrobium sp.]